MKQQLHECIAVLTEILGTDLLGGHLYGSFLVGGLQKYSDLDLFIVINRATTLEEKTAINPWCYPPFFDFQYGEWLRQSFEMGNFEPWTSREMPDFALIITQVLLKNHILLGKKPEQLLVTISYSDFIKAMLQDLERLLAYLERILGMYC